MSRPICSMPSLARLRSMSSLISSGWPVRMICDVSPVPKGRGCGFFAKGIREVEHHRRPIEQRHVGNRRVEEIAHLIADKLDQTVLIKLSGERLRDAVDGAQFGGTFADFMLAFD